MAHGFAEDVGHGENTYVSQFQKRSKTEAAIWVDQQSSYLGAVCIKSP